MKDWNYENEQWTKLPPHLRHLPLFTRHFDLVSLFFRWIWALFLKHIFFRFYIRLRVSGEFKTIYKEHPRLLVISNHSSHLDAISISTAIPFKYWPNLYFAAAKDYFFSGHWISLFSKHCIGAIPIERKDRNGEAIKLCMSLLNRLSRIWLVIFPEGTRSRDGYINRFKRGVSIFSEKANVPILFLYLQGASKLWPAKAGFAKPGELIVHVGPVHHPAPIDEVYEAYKKWVDNIEPGQFTEDREPKK